MNYCNNALKAIICDNYMIYLAVCQMAISRSPAIARDFSEILQARNLPDEIKFAGVNPESRFPLTDRLADSADLIFAADRNVEEAIVENYPPVKRLVNLDIQDIYLPGEPGEFSRVMFEPHVLGLREVYGLEESARVVSKEEIVLRWNLREVLKSRKLEQYLIPAA